MSRGGYTGVRAGDVTVHGPAKCRLVQAAVRPVLGQHGQAAQTLVFGGFHACVCVLSAFLKLLALLL